MEKIVSIPNHKILVQDVMMKPGEYPVISEQVILKEALEAMGMSRLGIVCIVDKNNSLIGLVTDGDIRRKLLAVQKPFSAFFVDDAIEHSIKSPKITRPDTSLIDAVEEMGKYQIWDLPVVDDKGTLVGLLHLHPAIKVLLDMD
jgi:CBS domain-containing protein